MQKIMLNDISEISVWPKRLLGLQSFKTTIRNNNKIEAEYNKDKYLKLLNFYKKNNISYAELRQYEMFKEIKNGNICFSKEDELFIGTFNEVQSIWKKILFEELKNEIKDVDTIIELGCGWGYNLKLIREKFPHINLIGGDYSVNGVELGNMLFKEDNIKLYRFDFYEKKWDIMKQIKPSSKCLVITSHAIEQIPYFNNVFNNFKKHSSLIKKVIHFEPIVELYSDTLMDDMRKKYCEMNDYNKDLIKTLSRKQVNLIDIKSKVFGINPFNPTSVVKWDWGEIRQNRSRSRRRRV